MNDNVSGKELGLDGFIMSNLERSSQKVIL